MAKPTVSEDDSWYVCQAVIPIPTTRAMICVTIPGRRLLARYQDTVIEKTSIRVKEGWGLIHRARSIERTAISKTRKSKIMVTQICQFPNRVSPFPCRLADDGVFTCFFLASLIAVPCPSYIEIERNITGCPTPVIYPFPA